MGLGDQEDVQLEDRDHEWHKSAILFEDSVGGEENRNDEN